MNYSKKSFKSVCSVCGYLESLVNTCNESYHERRHKLARGPSREAVHQLPRARYAAAKSILFKLESGLFGDISRSVSCARILNDRMVESLALIMATEDWKENGNVESDILIALCNLFQKVSNIFDGSAYASGGDFRRL